MIIDYTKLASNISAINDYPVVSVSSNDRFGLIVSSIELAACLWH